MIILAGGWDMFFKKLVFLVTFFFSFTHCGLEIGEETVNPFIYKVKGEGNFCDVLDYKKELKDYMNSTNYRISSQRVWDVFSCIASKIDQYEEGIFGSRKSYFTNDEVLNLLKAPFMSTGSTSFIINSITDPDYYPKFLSFKSSLIGVMKKYQNEEYVEFGGHCPKLGEQALSRNELDTFVLFLRNFSEFLISINVSSESLFRLLQAVHGTSPMTLTDDLFLTSFKTIIKNKLWDTSSNFFQHLDKESSDTVKDFLISMMLDYDQHHGNGVLTRGHIKYMLLNMYLVEVIFDLYDKNANFILEEDEILNAFCLFEPIISLFTFIVLEDSFFKMVLKPFFTEKIIFNYVLKYKKMPGVINLRIIKMKFVQGDESFKNFFKETPYIDYADLTQLFGNLSKKFLK